MAKALGAPILRTAQIQSLNMADARKSLAAAGAWKTPSAGAFMKAYETIKVDPENYLRAPAHGV